MKQLPAKRSEMSKAVYPVRGSVLSISSIAFVSFIEPNEPDRANRPEQPDRPPPSHAPPKSPFPKLGESPVLEIGARPEYIWAKVGTFSMTLRRELCLDFPQYHSKGQCPMLTIWKKACYQTMILGCRIT
jgi:hypothetical protein